MSTCHRIQKQLSDYVDGTLDTAVRNGVETHLATCTECARELRRLEELLRLLGSAEPVAAPSTFDRALKQRLQADSLLNRLRNLLSAPLRMKLPLQLATATALGLLIFAVVNTTLVKQELAPSSMFQKPSAAPKMIQPRTDGDAPSAEAANSDERDDSTAAKTEFQVAPSPANMGAVPPPQSAPDERPTRSAAFKKASKAPLPTIGGDLTAPPEPQPAPQIAAPRVTPTDKIVQEAKRLPRLKSKPKAMVADAAAQKMKSVSLVLFMSPSQPARPQESFEKMLGSGQRAGTKGDAKNRQQDFQGHNSGAARVRELLAQAGAQDVQLTQDPQNPNITLLVSRISARTYARLITRLTRMGQVRKPHPTVSAPPDARIELRIQLVEP